MDIPDADYLGSLGNVVQVTMTDVLKIPERDSMIDLEELNGDAMSDQIQGMLESGSKCPLCARTQMHTHSPEEIIIYRNGVKYGKRLVADLQAALAFEQKGTDAVMKVLDMEPTEGGNFNRLKACGIIRGMKAKLEAAQRLRDALADCNDAWESLCPVNILAAFDKEQQ